LAAAGVAVSMLQCFIVGPWFISSYWGM